MKSNGAPPVAASRDAGATRARSASIENVGRFLTDSLLGPGALEDFFKGDVARPDEVRDAFEPDRKSTRLNPSH